MIMSQYALTFIGTKYTWGGNSADSGFDCSGFILEVLASQGLGPKKDTTAQGLFDYFTKDSYHSNRPHLCNVLFFGKDKDNITHVALALDKFIMIEAGGEGSKSTKEGMVRIRPINSRSDLVAAIDPWRIK